MSSCISSNFIDERWIGPTLDDFCPDLSPNLPYKTVLDAQKKDLCQNGKWKLYLKIKRGNLIVLGENRCPICRRHLKKNGKNQKSTYNDKGEVEETFQLQRYFCKCCGEICIDYSEIIDEGGKYGEKYPRIVRLLFMLGLPPCRIQKVLIATNEILIPLSTIKSWIYPLRDELRMVLYPRNMPFSGSVSYDEMYIKIEGEKEYFLGLVDCRTNIVIRSQIVENLEKSEVKLFFKKTRREQNLVIQGCVMDGGTVGGNAFEDRSLKQIKRQRCHTHFKKTVCSQVYEIAGLGKKVKKELPKQINKILHAFYSIIDSKSDNEFDKRCKNAMKLIKESKNYKLSETLGLIKLTKLKLLQYLKTPYLDNTTNKSESLHHEIEVFPSLKNGQKSDMGADHISMSMIFIHNLRNVHKAIEEEENWYGYYSNKGTRLFKKEINRSEFMKYIWFKRKLIRYKDSLEEYWLENLPIYALKLFKTLWKQ